MKYLWYKTMRTYVRFGLQSFFKDIHVVGLENIPKNKAVLFLGNHRNGLLDPILISTTNNLIHHYLTRASAFKSSIADKLLRSINMIPIYRIRDGVNSVQKNKQIFDACSKIFSENESVIMFPEGEDGLPRHLRPLKKGFARILFLHLDKFPDADVMIVPVGLNYNNIFEIGGSVSIHYGKPISTREYYDSTNEIKAIDNIKQKVATEIKKLTTHITDLENHDKIASVLQRKGISFLDSNEATKLLNKTKNWEVKSTFPSEKDSLLSKFLQLLFSINTFLPILIWKKLKHKVNSIKLIPTFKFGISLGLIPIFYILQSIIVGIITNYKWGFVYFFFSILLLLAYKTQKNVAVNQIYSE